MDVTPKQTYYLNDEELIAIVAERLDNLDLSKTIPAEQVWQELGIDSKSLENCDEVELE